MTLKEISQTLYIRITGLLLLLLLMLTYALYLVFVNSFERLSKEAEQQLSLTLASNVAEDLAPDLEQGINISLLERRLAASAARYPRVDFYFLDQHGEVIAGSTGRDGTIFNAVDMAPIRKFLDTVNQPQLPLFGQDPITGDYSQVFSVAQLTAKEHSYYVYVILTGRTYRGMMQLLSIGHTMRSTVAAGVLAAGATGTLGIFLFFLLTKRIRLLLHGIRKLERGEYDTALPVEGNDEVAGVARAVSEMAKRIVTEMRSKEQSDELRRNLVARVSHDLRAPLTGLRGHLERLSIALGDTKESIQSRHAAAALESTLALQHLIDDLFELSKLEAQDKAPRLEAFSLLELIRDVLRRTSPSAEAVDVRFNVHVGDSVKTEVVADAVMISRAVQNLLDNAIHASSAGTYVQITICEVTDGLQLSITDTGKGIAQENLAQVFDAFFSTKAETGGTGLGLAIVKKIIEVHKGQLNVASAIGAGSTFSFTLPQAQAPDTI